MPAKKYVPWIATVLVLCYLFASPGAPDDRVQTAAGGLASAAGALATFVNDLAS